MYFCVFLMLFCIFGGMSFSSAFYMGTVWNMYEIGMAHAFILQEPRPVLAGLLDR